VKFWYPEKRKEKGDNTKARVLGVLATTSTSSLSDRIIDHLLTTLQVICYIDQSQIVVFLLSFIDWHQIYRLQVLKFLTTKSVTLIYLFFVWKESIMFLVNFSYLKENLKFFNWICLVWKKEEDLQYLFWWILYSKP